MGPATIDGVVGATYDDLVLFLVMRINGNGQNTNGLGLGWGGHFYGWGSQRIFWDMPQNPYRLSADFPELI